MRSFRWPALLWLLLVLVAFDTRAARLLPAAEIEDVPVADLTVSLTGPAEVFVNQMFQYVITVTNAGPDPATNVIVEDALPGGTSFTRATPSQGTCSGTTTVICTLGALEVGSSATINLVVFPDDCGLIRNTAIAKSDAVDPSEVPATVSTFVVEGGWVEIMDAAGGEEDGYLAFLVILEGAQDHVVTVSFTTRDWGDALAGRDYVATQGSVRFEPGETAKWITVWVMGDGVFRQYPKEFWIQLTGVSGAWIYDDDAKGLIYDTDPAPTVTIADVTQTEGDAGTTDFVFDVTLSAPIGDDCWVHFATSNGTATAPDDYASNNQGRVIIESGELQEKIIVKVTGDEVYEPAETFFVTLSIWGMRPPILPDSPAIGTIVNDDEAPLLKIDHVIEVEENEDTSFVFEVKLSAPSFQPVTVDYGTADDTATEDDYTPAAGALEFEPGVTLRTVTVPVLGDTLYENDERFFLKLTNASGATIATRRGEGWIQNDDAMPALSISDVAQPAATSFVFDVSLSAPSGIHTTVDFATSDGTATAPGDYTASSGTLIFEPGEMLRTIAIAVAGDTAVEPAQTFFVTLSNPHGAVLADDQGIGTIAADARGVADLSVVNVSPPWAYAGDTMHYLITVANAGPEAATNVAVTDTLPPGATLLSATPGQGTCSGTTTVNCTLGTIDAGSAATIDLMVTAPLTCGETWNTAAAQSDQIDPTVAAGTAPTVVLGRGRRRTALPRS